MEQTAFSNELLTKLAFNKNMIFAGRFQGKVRIYLGFQKSATVTSDGFSQTSLPLQKKL